jgi:hypothetical protein
MFTQRRRDALIAGKPAIASASASIRHNPVTQ